VALLGAPFTAQFPAAPRVRQDQFSLVWEACDDGRLLRVSCSALWDGELGDLVLQSRVPAGGSLHQLDLDRRADDETGIVRHLRWVENGRRTDARVVIVGDSLVVASVEGPANEASRIASERFLATFKVPAGAACPTTRLVRIDLERPHGDALSCRGGTRVFASPGLGGAFFGLGR
jgi:hypothetical protein